MSLWSKVRAIFKIKEQEVIIPMRAASLFREKCLGLSKEFPFLTESNYFNLHLPLILNAKGTLEILEAKIQELQKSFLNSVKLEMQKASIHLSIIEESGLCFIFLKLWVSFCTFELNKLLQEEKASQTEKSKNLESFFQKEFFYLALFLYQICLYLFKTPFSQETPNQREIFILVRDSITQSRPFSAVHEILRKEIRMESHHFIQEEVELNMDELQKLCMIRSVPAAFKESTNLLNEFNKSPSIDTKLLKAVQLIETIKLEMNEYRKINGMEEHIVYCADDVLSALTYIMWRLMKNIYGSCMYIEAVLCCEFTEKNYEMLSNELDCYGTNCRHSYETIKSVSMIGLLNSEIVYSMI